MSYNYYFKIVKKEVINTLLSCKSERDVYDTFKKFGFNAEKDEYDGKCHYSCPPYNILGDELKFGGECYSEELYKIGTELFTGKLAEYFTNYGIMFGGEELIELAINWTEEKIRQYYKDLIDNTFSNNLQEIILKDKYTKDGVCDTKQMHYDRLIEHCKNQVSMGWRRNSLNMDRSKYALTGSWLYELSIFNIVSFYKKFDPKTEYILFYGY